VAEDLPEDAEILKLAFSSAGVNVPLHFVSDGAEAIEYLKGEQRFANRTEHPLPTLLLLDLKMPRLNGFDVLDWLRLQPGLRRLLVVVFSSSALPEDINRAYELGANSYLAKPAGFRKLEEIARSLESYWSKLNLCPECKGEQTLAFPSIRVLLRNRDSGRYFKGTDQWTLDPEEALDFERSGRAVHSALGLNLPRAEVLIQLTTGDPAD
jgi:CheY-like chemotaxis protein